MRARLLGALALGAAIDVHAGADPLFADSFEAAPDCTATPAAPGCPVVFGSVSGITVEPGESTRACFYFRSANAASVGLERIRTSFTAPAWHLSLYATVSTANGTPSDRFPPGTVSSTGCTSSDLDGTRARLLFRTPRASDVLEMPRDDGTGVPVGLPIAPTQPLFVLVELVNPTDQPADASATVSGFALSEPAFTPTATYLTVNANIAIPPGVSNHTAAMSCPVPAAAKFWYFTPRTYGLGVNAKIERTGPAPVTLVDSNDWQDPDVAVFAAPFVVFAGGESLRSTCTWNNQTGRTVTFGEDPQNDETCEVLTYFFPATEPKLCVNGAGPL